MKTQTKLFITLSFLLAAAALFYGCKEDAFDNDGNDIATGYTYHITAETGVTQKQVAANGKTRSLSLDNNNVVLSAWEAGDQLMAYNLSDSNQSTQTAYSLLNVAQAGIGTQYSAFEGTVVSQNPMSTNDRLCFFYPGGASTDSNPTIIPVVKESKTLDVGDSIYHYDVYEPANTLTHLVQMDLSEQDGTIATIGKKFDYQWAAVRPKAVNGNEVQCEIGPLQREIAIWAIQIYSPDYTKHHLTRIEIDASNNAVFDLNTGSFVHSPYGIIRISGKIERINQQVVVSPIDVQNDYIYFAVVPGTYKYEGIAWVSDSTQWGQDTIPHSKKVKGYHSATFEKNHIYRTIVRKADKEIPLDTPIPPIEEY